VDVERGRAALGAAIEDEQRALGRDRVLFGELDRDAGLALADDRVPTDLFDRLGIARLQLAAGAGGVALDVDGGGWVPSVVRTLPAAVNAIGVYLLFESAFGVTPLEPSIVTSRLPARTIVSFAATAMPATASAIRAARAVVIKRCLRISLYLSFAACPS
jgi:hypothetical protein